MNTKQQKCQEEFEIKNDFLYHCCGARLVKAPYDSVLVNFPVYCDKCKKEIIVTVINGKLVS